MTRRHTLAIRLLLTAGLWAVGAGCPDDDPATDGGTASDGGGAVVEMGSGGIDVFEPVEDGDTVELVRGCQGGQHVWIGLRAWHLDTQPALIVLRGRRVSDGEVVSIETTVRLRFTEMDEYDQILGLQLIIPDPADVLGQEIDITAQVSEDFVGGRTVTATHRVQVEWGDETCGFDGDAGPALRGDGGLEDAGPTDAGV